MSATAMKIGHRAVDRAHGGAFRQSPEDRLEHVPNERCDSGRGRAIGGGDVPSDTDSSEARLGTTGQ